MGTRSSSASTGEATSASQHDGEHERAESSGATDAELRLRVLEAAMLHVPKTGWTVDSLTAGAASCGLSPMAHGLLQAGPIELVEHFSASCNERLTTEMSKRATELEGLEVHNRLIVAMQVRLRMVAPYAATWPQALALRTVPANLPRTMQDGHDVALQLLDACGAEAREPIVPQPIDPIAKVVAVAAIYGAAELHLTTDGSPEFSDTWTFVEREVEALTSLISMHSRLPDLSPASLVLAYLSRPR